MMGEPSEINEELASKVHVALKVSFTELLDENPDHTFYAFGIFTDDSLQFAHPVANSEEALAATVDRYQKEVDPKYGCHSTLHTMRWAYGDWGFFPDVGGEHFEEVNAIVQENFDAPEEVFESQLEILFNSVLEGFRRLEAEEFFGTGEARSKITLLPVGHIDEELADHWVKVLNPPEVNQEWLSYDPNAE